MDIKLIIPARYKSTRFPGKPLVEIKGKSMINRVWDRAVSGIGVDKVYIATDSSLIHEHCRNFTRNIIMTSEKCLTGTDRIAECSLQLKADIYINIQGDEPLIDPKDILFLIEKIKQNPNKVYNFMKKITSNEELNSVDIPKVVTDNNNNLLYMSRLPVPTNSTYESAYKQVCIYAFPLNALKFFGIDKSKSKNEVLENIEILRLIDNGINVEMLETKNESYAVDRQEDLEKVLNLID